MLNFEQVKKHIEEVEGCPLPTYSESEVDFYTDIYDTTHANFADEDLVINILQNFNNAWLDEYTLAVELFSGDCRNISYIKKFTGTNILALDIQDRNLHINDNEFMLGDCFHDDFNLPKESVDSFFSFNGGITIIPNIDAIKKHFKGVSKHLKQGGTYYAEYTPKVKNLDISKTLFDKSKSLYVVTEVLDDNSFVFHDVLLDGTLKNTSYSVSSIQTTYSMNFYKEIASNYDLVLEQVNEEFGCMLFRKL